MNEYAFDILFLLSKFRNANELVYENTHLARNKRTVGAPIQAAKVCAK